MVAFVVANRAHLAAWEPERSPDYYTIEEQRALLGRAAIDAAEGRGLRLWIFEGADAIGHVGISNIVRGAFQSAHLGFAIAHDRQGSGRMHEALEAAVAFAFGPLGLHRLEANHLPENERSARLLARLGFVRTGLAPRYLRIAGQWRDHVQTQRVHDGWSEPTPS